MFDKLRIPFFCASVVCLVIVFAVELGTQFFLNTDKDSLATPGLGILYLAWLDWLLLFTILLMGTALIVPDRIHGRIQGIITFIVALLTLLGAIVAIFTAFGLLMLMVSLLLAVPFGTAIYFAEFADFKVGAAAATLAFIMIFKVAFVIFLVLAHQRFLQNRGLVFLIATSLVATILLGFLHGIAPPFLAYITDDIGALIIAILAAIWALFFLIGSIPAVIKALRIDRALKQ
ncbi:hypothetical protein SAMN05216326_10160 [Nitrosomonas marina]|uniref:Uncharacterized protein n=1 Tax=Nitrosomonas marina TaxID=917 RepID=A0A1H9Y580_9PROT|nr:hypothetical protein [Nitrosomonas marina]SES63537.1 hypothetical protein SAMN05216326_10160 [Nitrosomonas marina]